MSERGSNRRGPTDDEAPVLQSLFPEEAQLLCVSDKVRHRAGSSPSSWGAGCRPASTHLSFIFRAQHIGETRGCSDICRAGWLGVTERWHSWPSLQCYPHGHQEHGWWKGTILKWLSGQQISMGKAVRAREEDIMNAPR